MLLVCQAGMSAKLQSTLVLQLTRVCQADYRYRCAPGDKEPFALKYFRSLVLDLWPPSGDDVTVSDEEYRDMPDCLKHVPTMCLALIMATVCLHAYLRMSPHS